MKPITIETLSANKKLPEHLQKAHADLLELSRLLIEVATTTKPVSVTQVEAEPVEVSIHFGTNADPVVFIDGVEKVGAPRRTLIALALLRQWERLTPEDFIHLYSGDASGSVEEVFGNCVNRIDGLSSAITVPVKGYRKMSGLSFVVDAADDVMRKFLASFYKKS